MDEFGVSSPQRLELDGAVVTALPIGSFMASYELLDGLTSDDAVSLLESHGCATVARVHAHAFAVETEDNLVLVDAGMGAGSALDGLASSLQAAGIDQDRVDHVVVTHLHPDHANGLLDGIFPSARVVVPAAEVAFARDPDAIAAAGPYVERDYARAADVLDAIGDRLLPLPLDAEASPPPPAGLVAVPLPGHSPGHTGYRLSRPDGSVLFVGDLLHFPDLQGRHPGVSVLPDFDARLAAATRRNILERALATGETLAGAHLGPPGFRQVVTEGNGTRLD